MSSSKQTTSVFWGNQYDDAPDTWRKHRAGSDFSPVGTAQVRAHGAGSRLSAQWDVAAAGCSDCAAGSWLFSLPRWGGLGWGLDVVHR
jgi:hypothetical protein